MKKIIFTYVIISAMPLFALTETIDGITWTYVINDGVASVGGGNSSSPAVPMSTVGSITIPQELGGYAVTAIGNYAFYKCDGLTDVMIPDSVQSIGVYAFYKCSGLTSITIPSSVNSIGRSAFSVCTGLRVMTLPFVGWTRGNIDGEGSRFGYIFGDAPYANSIAVIYPSTDDVRRYHYIPTALENVEITDETIIAQYAFSNCEGLKSVSIQGSVTNIERYAFSNCSSLTNLTIQGTVDQIGSRAFFKCSNLETITIPSSVIKIGDSAFDGCDSMRFDTETIPGVKLVDGWAVGYTEELHGDIDLVGCRGVGDYAFSGCSGLTDVTMSDGIKGIGNNAFANCSGLTNITIPKSVVSIGSGAFCGCYGLKSIVLPFVGSQRGNSRTSEALFGYIFGSNSYSGGTTIRQCYDISMTGGYEYSGSYATFCIPTALKTVTITDETLLGIGAFFNCSEITSVSIPKSVMVIEEAAFSGCGSMTSIILPFVGSHRGDAGTKTSVFGYVFGSVPYNGGDLTKQYYTTALWKASYVPTALKSVTITDETIIGYGAFYDCDDLTSIKIPNSVTNIGGRSFYNCNGLTSVAIPQCVCMSRLSSVFPASYQAITNVVINEGVTSIGNSAFSGCASLPSLAIHNSVTYIGSGAFAGCGEIKNITIPQYVCSSSISHIFGDSYQSITNVVIADGVTSIGAYAFSGCTNMTNITMPDSVSSIGDYAFNGCRKLDELTIGSGVSTVFGRRSFDGCVKLEAFDVSNENQNFKVDNGVLMSKDGETLVAFPFGETEVEIPYGVKNIGDYAFYNCTELSSVLIPETVTNIGVSAFYNCSGLTSIEIPRHVSSIGSNAFAGCTGLIDVAVPQCLSNMAATFPSAYQALESVVIDDGVGSISDRMFAGCRNLANITFPSSMRSIGKDAFDGCNSLSKIRIFDVASWAEVSFANDIGKSYALYLDSEMIRQLSVPNGVTYIASYAFTGCESIESVMLPEGLTNVGKSAFAGCDNLARVALPSTLTSLGDWDLRDREVDGSEIVDGFRICNGWVLGYYDNTVARLELPDGIVGIAPYALSDFWDLEEVVLPDSLKYIGYGAFMNDTYLDEVIIPDSVEYIDDKAFKNCTYIRDISIGHGVARIGDEAFANCTQLMALSMPDGICEIGNCAFSNCWRMLSVKLPLNLETIGKDMFASCSSLTGVSVPSGKFTMNQLLGARSVSVTSAVVVDGETAICTNAFANCTSLETIRIPEGVTNIQAEAFRNCAKLREVSLPETLEGIGEQAFYGCSKLSAIVMPDSVSFIGNGAFRGCALLNSVTLSRSLYELPDYAFNGCNSLVSIVVPTSVTRLGAYISNRLVSLYFLGNAPAYDVNAYASLPTNAKTYVVQGSRGWDGIPSSRDLPSSWIGRSITTWTPNRFYATFDANEGLFPDSATTYACEQITDTKYAIPPFEPTRTAYAFAGWWTDKTDGAQIKATTKVNETRDITFYAHWELVNKPVTVRFYANGGTVEQAEATYYSGLTYETLPVPTKEHYRFVGWFNRAEGGIEVLVSSEVPAADTELFAHWMPETYVIRYNANGGSGNMADQPFVYGAGVTLRANSFVKQQCLFVGWALSEDGPVVYADNKEISTIGAIQGGVINLYAQWTAMRYAVRYDSNGGLGVMTNDTFTIGVAGELAPNAFTRAGHVFIGWATTADGEVAYGDCETVVDLTTSANGNVSLFAVWARNTSNVAFSFSGDSPWRPARFAREGEVVWQSGAIGDGEISDIVATVNGNGTISFEWSSSCEESHKGIRQDYLAFFVDGEEMDYINGSSAWATKSWTVADDGHHVLKWSYVKDSAGVGHDDCARITRVVWEPVLSTLAEFANAPNIAFSTTGDAAWFGQTAVSHDGIAALQSGAISDGEETRLECSVVGAGELSFWWKASCEGPHKGNPQDCASFVLDGSRQMWIAGETDWTNVVIRIDGNERHNLCWIFQKDVSDGDGDDCAWLDEVVWMPLAPTIEGDDGVRVEGDAQSGFVVKSSKTEGTVEVTIPDGVTADNVTVEVAATVETVTANGAKVKVMKGGYDIAEHLNLDAVTQGGVINLANAKVKEDVVKEALDTAKGATVSLGNTESPTLTTAATKPGLTYTLQEGTTLEEMKDGDRKVGDGTAWTPKINVKGGTSGFYTIKVEK